MTATTAEIRQALVTTLEGALDNVQVYPGLRHTLPHTPGVIVARAASPVQYMEQVIPAPAFDLICVLDLADDFRPLEMDDLTDAVTDALVADSTLGGVVATVQVVETGDEKTSQLVGGQWVLNCAITAKVFA